MPFGIYHIELLHSLKSPRLIVQDSKGNAAVNEGVAPGVILFDANGDIKVNKDLNAGDYTINVEDGLSGGDYCLVITHYGAGS
ncbi:MAG TPA: hypothetical protein VMW69_16285 [Spirochaetia bacterium]|nr:hypothetical protein [Spirochaetia bacterium]